ncbi:MAG TPA: asparagine synthase-related protein [Vicinamibacterales bacterium]|nr:asparagine synthase-related protein [Vicinamibacterales bacterium]
MSAMVGCVYRAGAPASGEEVAGMLAALAARAHDAERVVTAGAAAFGFQAFHTTCESESEIQPHVDIGTGRVIVFDGRLDNRDELGAGTRGDAAVVLDAYQRWGASVSNHLVGDFAFAVWDPSAQTLFCSRDAIGVRPLYYHVTADRFLFTTDYRALIASRLIDVRPNEGMVAEYLSNELRSVDQTLYDGVRRLPAAHSLILTRRDLSIRRYWDPTALPDVVHQSDDEYAAHFFHLFRRSVRSCMRSSRQPVGVYLSGGVDSSAVVGMAQTLASDGAVAPPVHTFSMVFPDDPEADERPYLDAVDSKWQLPSHRFVATVDDIDAIRAHVARRLDVADAPADLGVVPIRQAVASQRGRVLLSGVGGDHGFGGSLFHYAEHIRSGEWRAWWHQLRADRQVSDMGFSLRNVAMHSLLPLVPRSIKDATRPIAQRLGWPGGAPPWIRSDFAARVALGDRLRYRTTPSNSARADVCESFVHAWMPWGLEKLDHAGAEFGVEDRHPFLDRRLVEFAIGIPESQRWSGTKTKFVLRRAMRDLLPETVYDRTDKGDFTGAVARAVDVLAADGVYRNMRSEAYGWVDGERVRRMYDDMRRKYAVRDSDFGDHVFPLWFVGGIELWLNAAFC